ncbi:MAG: transporter [Candidatus Saccharibacteria bacterium]|nr:transporter [Candidatus Saccharibacteria bacterium]
MRDTIKRLKQKYHYSVILLKQLVVTDFKLRYQGSALGYIWSLLRPLFLFVILYLVFDKIFNAGASIPHYPVYLLLGIVLWNYFGEVTNGGVTAIVAKGDLLRKLNFPKYVIVLTGSFSAFINLLINFIVVAIFMVINGVSLEWSALLLPLPLIELFVFSIGIAFMLGALFVKFRDINYIWEIIMQAAFYATPILYSLSFVIEKSEWAAKLLMLNPVAQIIQDARYVLISHQTITYESLYGSGWYRLIPLAIVIIFTVLAATYFRSKSADFAEEI